MERPRYADVISTSQQDFDGTLGLVDQRFDHIEQD